MNQNTNISQVSKQSPSTSKVDVGDLWDIYSLAECDLTWMNTSIEFLRRGIQELQQKTKSGEVISEHHFISLLNHAEMYAYLSEERHRHYEEMAEKYQKEWELVKSSKSGVNANV